MLAFCITALPILTACNGLGGLENELDNLLGTDSSNANGSTISSSISGNTKPSPGVGESVPSDSVGSVPEDSSPEESTDDSTVQGGNENETSPSVDGEKPKPDEEKPESSERPTPETKSEIDEETGLKYTLSANGDFYNVSVVKPLKVTHLVIPSEYKGVPVTTIEKNAFSGCTELQSIVLPNGLTHISAFSFFKCSNLEAIIIPSSVIVIGSYAFDGCESLNIYCETDSQPQKWDKKWNPDDLPVTWGFSCEHEWQDATCTEPYVCSICGAVDGEALGHDIVDGACTRCDYEEEKDNNGDEAIVDDNIASFADITLSYDWWASDPQYLVDGDRSTASLNDIHSRFATFTFTWDKSYYFNTLVFVVNGQGKAPASFLSFDEMTNNSFNFTVALYDEEDTQIYYSYDLNSLGIEECQIDVNCMAKKMVLTIEGNFTCYPIFEIETYATIHVAECEHSWIDATCTEPKVCSVCGVTDGCELGHNYAVPVIVEPTCVDEGYSTLTCERCDYYSYYDYLPATGHYFHISETVEPTCVDDGYSVMACERCDYCNYTDYVAAIGHSFVDGVCILCGVYGDIKVTYNYFNGNVWETANPNKDGSYTLRTTKKTSNGTVTMSDGTVVDKEFYGWFDRDGNLYYPGETVYFTKDTYLYEAYGVTVYTADDLKTVIANRITHNYVKLGTDITITNTISIDWNIGIIDLNGHTLTSTAKDYAFSVLRGSFALAGEGSFVHEPSVASTSALASGVLFRGHGYGDRDCPQLFWIGKDVEFTTPYDVLCVQSVVIEKTPNIYVAGTVNANSLACIKVATTNALCEITKHAELNLSNTFITFYNTTGTGNYMTITLDGNITVAGGNTVSIDQSISDRVVVTDNREFLDVALD